MKIFQCHIFILVTAIFVSILSGQDKGSRRFISYPGSFSSGEIVYSAGLSLTLLPRQIVEEEIRHIPMVNASLRYGFPSNFSVIAHLSTVYITNALSVGLIWSIPYDGFAFAMCDELSYWFGIADLNGFDTNAMGLINRPSVSAGIDVDGYKISAKTEMIVLLAHHTYFGTASVGRFKPELAGIATTFILEQEIAHTAFMSFSLRANYARPNYQIWLAFSVQDRWLLFPEIQLSYLW